MFQRPLWLFLLTTPAAAQTTWIVETGNPQAMPSLAAAVAAASDGDVIRIRNAVESVAGLLITKSLRIIGEGVFFGLGTMLSSGATGAPLLITVGAGKEVCIANCALGWSALGFPLRLSITGCDGRVTLQDTLSGSGSLQITASRQVVFAGVAYSAAQSPIQIGTSTVVLERSTIYGRRADMEFGYIPSTPAASISQSTVHCVNSTIRGGDGHPLALLPGSRALSMSSSTLIVAGSASVVASGNLTTESAVQATDSLLILDPPLAPTITATNTTVLQHPLPSVQPTNFASGQTAALALRTPIGSLSALLVGMPGDRAAVAGVSGDLWLDPQVMCTPVLAVQNGSLGWTVVIPPSPALFATPIRWQGAMLHQGAVLLGAPGSALLR